MKTQIRQYSQSDSGFSLIELVVGLVVTAIFLLGVYQVFIAQQDLSMEQSRIQEAQQGIRVALDLINNDFRSGSLETVDMHLDGEVERIKGLLVWDGTGSESDTLYLLKIVRDPDYTAISRRATLAPGDTLITLNAFGDTMQTTTSDILVADAQPLIDYMDDNGLDFSDGPLIAQLTGPDLERYPFFNHAGTSVRDVGNYVTTIPEIFFINSITNSSAPAADRLDQTTVSQWNGTDGLARRYGYFGYPPTNVSPREPGLVPTPGSSDIIITPVNLIGWYVRYDANIERYRLIRVENGRAEVVADDIRDFQVIPAVHTAESYKIKIEAWIPRYGADRAGEFIVRTDSLVVYR